MTPQELKSSILQLSFQGKLVEQRTEEGTGEELFLQIQAERQAMIKAGRIKKGKAYPSIDEDEISFDIPETWIWARLQDLVYNRGQKVPNKTFCYIDIGSIDNKRQKLNPEDNAIEANKAPSRARKIVQMGDILYSTVRPYLHNMCIIDREFSLEPIASTGFAAMTCFEGINSKYLFYYLLSPSFDGYANDNENAKGVAYPAINDDRLYRAVVPLPPLAEQKRIVAKIEELLPYIDCYEKAWSRLEDFNKRFPVDMQKSILQMAIQGKLVPQLPEEGTGEELFQKIQAEKQRLINAGTIKKEKPLPEITDDEIPFDIPESWKWVRVGDYVQKVTDYVASGSFASLRENVKIYKEPNYAILVKTKDFQSNFTNDLTYTDKHGYEFLENSRLFGGELIMPNIGASIGKVFKVPYLDAKMTLAPNSVLIRFVSEEHLDWFSYYFASPIGFAQLKTISASTAQAKFSKTEFKGLLIPVPPLAEQKRIVAKLDEILPLCERLK